jgi:hypothetical protein
MPSEAAHPSRHRLGQWAPHVGRQPLQGPHESAVRWAVNGAADRTRDALGEGDLSAQLRPLTTDRNTVAFPPHPDRLMTKSLDGPLESLGAHSLMGNTKIAIIFPSHGASGKRRWTALGDRTSGSDGFYLGENSEKYQQSCGENRA